MSSELTDDDRAYWAEVYLIAWDGTYAMADSAERAKRRLYDRTLKRKPTNKTTERNLRVMVKQLRELADDIERRMNQRTR